jgi:hypothetical protein
MRNTLDIYTDGLDHNHNALELSVEHMKRRGNYFFICAVGIQPTSRSFVLFGNDKNIRHYIDQAGRLNTKKLNAMREKIFAHVDRDKLVEYYKAGDTERVISEVLAALEAKVAA